MNIEARPCTHYNLSVSAKTSLGLEELEVARKLLLSEKISLLLICHVFDCTRSALCLRVGPVLCLGGAEEMASDASHKELSSSSWIATGGFGSSLLAQKYG